MNRFFCLCLSTLLVTSRAFSILPTAAAQCRRGSTKIRGEAVDAEAHLKEVKEDMTHLLDGVEEAVHDTVDVSTNKREVDT